MTTMTVAINLLVPALTGLGNLSLAQIGTGLLAIAGAFGVVGAAAMLLAPVAPVVIGLSLAISALAVSVGAMVALTTAADFFGRLGELERLEWSELSGVPGQHQGCGMAAG